MGASTNETKEMAKRILATVKKITPELAEIAKYTEFEIVITNDKDGLGIEFSMDWDPTRDDDAHLDIEEVPVGDLDNLFKMQLKSALQKANGNIKKAAAICGMSVRGFKKHMFRMNVLND